jgi:hypothetical protein
VTRGRRNVVVAVVLSLGLLAGLTLVLLGGGDDEDDTTTTSAASTTAGEPLPLEDTSQAALTELSGIVFPADASDFLTARTDDGRQLDVSFLIPASSVAAFVESSGLPEPVADERVIAHSSPLWKLNPDPGSTLSGVADTYDGATGTTVGRAVELVTAPDGTVRARIVISAG